MDSIPTSASLISSSSDIKLPRLSFLHYYKILPIITYYYLPIIAKQPIFTFYFLIAHQIIELITTFEFLLIYMLFIFSCRIQSLNKNITSIDHF